ncbi:MAG: SgcJ/EcaC family oxidoreductase [Actinomycetota bacterium]|nr:SgcJ/EcaC family oxidoreductase [Actinomycetota bacterium]
MSTTTSMAITEADEDAIRDLVALAQESQSDPEALMALHTAETAIVNLAGRRVLGREAYAKAVSGALASPLSDVLTTAEIVDIRLATPDVAIVSCTKTVHDRRSGVDVSTALPSTGALTYVTTRSHGGWRIAHTQTTPILTLTNDDLVAG